MEVKQHSSPDEPGHAAPATISLAESLLNDWPHFGRFGTLNGADELVLLTHHAHRASLDWTSTMLP